MRSETKIIHGTKVPAIGLGTWDLRGEACESVVEQALELGYRHIDTAKMYANEKAIGNALRNTAVPRNDLFITTKVWPDAFEKNKFFKSVENSLNSLDIEQVDLLLIHWPRDEETNIRATDYLFDCYEKKYAKHVGVSNFSLSQLKQAQKQAPIFCNQVEFNIYHNQSELLKYCQEQDIMLTAYHPIDKGNFKKDPKLIDIGKKYHKTAIQVALRWLVQQDKVFAIPKASSKEHLLENLNVFDFELTVEEMKSFGG